MICATIVLGLSTLAYASNAFVILVGFSLVNVAAFLAYDERPSFWWLVAALVVQCAIVARVRGRSFARAVPWLAESANATAIEAPFAGLWMVAAGGPFAAGNHHLRARDQRFAYDFIRLGKSLGAPILAPCAGIVARVHDGERDLPASRNPDGRYEPGRELGNYVAIEASFGYVFLCHLRAGSIAVRLGDRVETHDPIGACGNSGRTTLPHLHIHAQDRADYAFDDAIGVPIRFRAARGRARVLQKWSFVRGRKALARRE